MNLMYWMYINSLWVLIWVWSHLFLNLYLQSRIILLDLISQPLSLFIIWKTSAWRRFKMYPSVLHETAAGCRTTWLWVNAGCYFHFWIILVGWAVCQTEPIRVFGAWPSVFGVIMLSVHLSSSCSQTQRKTHESSHTPGIYFIKTCHIHIQ